MPTRELFEPIAKFAVNQIFNWAPFRRANERPIIKPMPNGAETIEITYDNGVEIRIVAVATVEMKRAYVISADRDLAAGNTFKLTTENRLVPIDLFLGWDLMSSPLSARMFDYQKIYGDDGSRSIIYRSDDYKVTRAAGRCAYTHFMNPINFSMPRAGDCVSFEGYLVNVFIDNVCTWSTDVNMGDENCETIYPTMFKILE